MHLNDIAMAAVPSLIEFPFDSVFWRAVVCHNVEKVFCYQQYPISRIECYVRSAGREQAGADSDGLFTNSSLAHIL